MSSSIHPVLIISYEMFLKSHEALHSVHFDLVICDEGHRLKNSGGKTTSVSKIHMYECLFGKNHITYYEQ